MGVATNTDWAETESKLSRTGLAKYFQFFSCLDGLMAPKPAPDLYVRGIRWVRDIIGDNVDPHQIMAIEDTCLGAIAAHRAGCCVILWPQDRREVLVESEAQDLRSILIADSADDSIAYMRGQAG
jgi:beta-phosphoglucomutase-like phosphatase (HAD superfamily)